MRGFLNFSSNEAYKTSISCEASTTFEARSFQSRAPATQNAKMTSPLESLKRQNEHFVRDFLQISHFQLENRRFRASFLIKPFLQSSKSMTFAKLPPLFRTLTKCCACHDICRDVTFARPCHCDSWKQHLRHVTKCCAGHDIAKGHLKKCGACHEKTTRLL